MTKEGRKINCFFFKFPRVCLTARVGSAAVVTGLVFKYLYAKQPDKRRRKTVFYNAISPLNDIMF